MRWFLANRCIGVRGVAGEWRQEVEIHDLHVRASAWNLNN